MYFFSDVFLLYMSSAFVIISHTEEGACSPETLYVVNIYLILLWFLIYNLSSKLN